jgi:hypothetical protein
MMSTVGDLRRIAGCDQTVLLEGRLQHGQSLGGGTRANALVGRHHLDVAIDSDRNRNQFVFESPLCCSPLGTLLALRTECVEIFACDAVFNGDHVGTDALWGKPRLLVPIDQFLRERRTHFELDNRRAHRRARHHFHAGSHHDVVGAGDDALGAEMHRLLA